jgi:type IV pilus assembly protein PilY1
MSRSHFNKLFHLLLTFSLVTLQGIVSAEDTEIYFSSGSTTGNTGEVIRPNILFILDTSGSMTDTIPEAANAKRIDVLKDAVKSVLNDVEDVNVGLMRYTNDDGGPILFPVTYIDGNVADVVGEVLDPVVLSYESTITNGVNDGEENLSDNTVTLGEPVLEYVEVGASSAIISTTQNLSFSIQTDETDAEETTSGASNGKVINDTVLNFIPNNLVGLRFDDVDDDAGDNDIRNAKILNAYLDFDINSKKTSTTNVVIYGENANDPIDFTTCASCKDISTRSRTSAVNWNGLPASNRNATITSPNLKDIVQAIVSRGCASAPSATPDTTGCTYGNDDMVFFIETLTGERILYSRDSSSTRQPRLRIEIETTTSVAVPGDKQRIGYRFENIQIPQGAVVTGASLVLTPSATGGTAGDTEWTIQAHNSNNSRAFTTVNGNFSGRALTTAQAKWKVPAFTAGDPVETTDNSGSDTLTGVLQEVVDRVGWCGGNAVSLFVTAATNSTTVFRESESFDGSTGTPPKLKYSFKSGSTGCYAATESSQSGVEGDDAEEASDGAVNITDIDLDLGSDTVGVRFQGVDVPNGATILEASIIFTAQNTSTGAASFTIKGELPDDGSANIFSNVPDSITDRTYTSTVAWSPEDWITGSELYSTSDLTSIVQTMVNEASWQSGNAMVFVVEPGTGSRIAESNNSDPARAPRLSIRYADTAETQFKSVRERLIEVVDGLPASGNTPITETMYEAARYWRAEGVDFGKKRDSSARARISHPGSYCKRKADNTLDCRGATVGTGDGEPDPDIYGVTNLDACDMSVNPNSTSCAGETINGSPKYISPFNSELTCQNNYQVLLTDGAANSSSAASRTKVSDMIGTSCMANNSTFMVTGDTAITYSDSERCTVDLMKFLKENDQSTASVGDNLDNEQIVRTYTIAFNLDDVHDQQFLKDMTTVGDGQAFTAITAGDLVDVFTSILTDVKSDPTSFVSPSLATNAFNRLLSRDEVYFGLFTPALNTAWPGNVKKYNICVDSSLGCSLGAFLDANGDVAIDPADDKFKDTAQSIWSSSVDGRATTEGGSGAEITDFTTVTLYTESSNGTLATSSTPLSTTGYNLTSLNWAVPELTNLRAAVCPTPSTTAGSDCENRMLWLLGKAVTADPDTDISGTQRWSTNDILHSSPSVITYGGQDNDNDGTPAEAEDTDGIISTFFDKIVVGTNDGSIRMINGTDGSEDWRFMPSEFWSQQQTLFTNPQTNHIYGLDVTPTLYIKDVDNNGRIETGDGDFVKVYMGARMGNRFLYALNVSANVTSTSQKVVPKFMWKIQGGVTSGFERLGQTWSQPRLAEIATTSGKKTVLIFGGGYDPVLESPAIFSPADNGGADFKGNAIFIIDPETGAKILSISGASSGADIEISPMGYSIPSRISILDSNGDGLDDRLYVGDTGGQIWRVDLGSDIKASGGLDASCLASTPATCTSTIVGRLASLSSTSVAAQKRRFFEPPSIVQVRDSTYSDQADYDYVLLGSGYRSRPLNTVIHDRFYAVRDRHISGLTDSDGDHYSEITDGYADGSGAAITNAGLIDATMSILDTSDATKQSDGWYYDFHSTGNTGEKVLSAPNATAGGVTFTTFRPGAATVTNPCEGTLGNATAYNFSILNGNAFLDWDTDGDIDLADRAMALGGGIPSDVVPVFTKEGVIGIVGIEGGASQLGVLAGLPRFRTYWYEE